MRYKKLQLPHVQIRYNHVWLEKILEDLLENAESVAAVFLLLVKRSLEALRFTFLGVSRVITLILFELQCL